MPNAVDFQAISSALKDVYLPVVENLVSTKTSPLLAAIKETPSEGLKVKSAAKIGLNGGVGFSADNEQLPKAGGQIYKTFESQVKDLYAPIEFSSKAALASATSRGAFFNAVATELDGAVEAAKWNVGRALFGNGTGILANTSEVTSSGNTITLDNTQYVIEGLTIDVYETGGTLKLEGRRILSVDRENKAITLDGEAFKVGAGFITVQKSYNREIDGLGAIFDDSVTEYLGVPKAGNDWLKPTIKDAEGEIDDEVIYDLLVELSEYKGSEIDMIIAGTTAYREYMTYLKTIGQIPVANLELKGGFKALSFAFGNREIPIVYDKFAGTDEMIAVDTKMLELQGMGGWDWMRYRDGSVFERVPGYPIYQAVLEKHCNLICKHPGGIGKIINCKSA